VALVVTDEVAELEALVVAVVEADDVAVEVTVVVSESDTGEVAVVVAELVADEVADVVAELEAVLVAELVAELLAELLAELVADEVAVELRVVVAVVVCVVRLQFASVPSKVDVIAPFKSSRVSVHLFMSARMTPFNVHEMMESYSCGKLWTKTSWFNANATFSHSFRFPIVGTLKTLSPFTVSHLIESSGIVDLHDCTMVFRMETCSSQSLSVLTS